MSTPRFSACRHWMQRARLVAALAGLLTALAPASQASSEPYERVSFAGRDVTLTAVLYKPAGPGPFPAVVALHGCGGLFNRAGIPSQRHADWGARLAAQGFMVLMPDSFGSRGLTGQCGVADRKVRATKERVSDAFDAKAWLQKRFDVKPDAISLLGWSNGGTTVLAAAKLSKAAAQEKTPDFAKAVAFYPGCRSFQSQSSYKLRMPLLILMGDADDWTPAGPCEALATMARGQGDALDIVLYPGAFHDFDHPNLELSEREGLAFSADGSGKAHIGTNPEARADALRRVPVFLAH